MKILLSAGHGGTDGGSIGVDKGKEKDRTIDLANRVATYLKNAGHNVTVNQEKTSSGAWCFKNRNGYDYALSIHFNAFNGTATGTECLYKTSLGKAQELSKAVADILGIKNRGAKQRTDLYMMNIGFDNLIEVCFHDNGSDLSAYNANKDKVAQVIAETINGKSITSNVSSNNASGSIVDYLKSIGVDSSFNNRAKLAKQYGISNYKGTSQQNITLLNKLKSGTGTSDVSSTNYYAKYNGNSGSLVDALKSLNINGSFSNRKNIAKANGISNYTGTASQNTKLLSLLKQGKLKK